MGESKFMIGAETMVQLGFSVKECIEFLEMQPAVDITPLKVKRLMKYKAYCANCRMNAACYQQQITDAEKCAYG